MSRERRGGLGAAFAFTVAVIVAFLAAPAVTSAQAANPVYPPGLEAQVAALVFRGDGEPLGPRIEVGGARIEGDRIEVELRDGETPVGHVWLTHRDARVVATELGTTPSFAVWLTDGAERPGVSDAADALRARVASRDDGALRDVAGIPSATGMRSAPATLRFDPWRRAALWIALLALLVFLATRERTLLLPAGRAQRLALLALVGLALALRLALPSWAPLHANEHGIAELRALSGGGVFQRPLPRDRQSRIALPPQRRASRAERVDVHRHTLSGAELDPRSLGGLLFGEAYLDLVLAILAPFGAAPHLVLALGAIFGALAVLLLHRVVAQLVTGPWGPALAALGLALHPAHVRLSLSESPRPLAGALLLLGILCGLCARRASAPSLRAAAIVAASIAWALAAELRVITVALPLAGLAFVILAGRASETAPTSGGLRRAAVPLAIAVGALIVVATLASHLSVLEAALADGASRPPVDWLRRATAKNILFDPELSAVVLVPFALLGAALLWRAGERRVVIACAVAVALLVPPSLFVCACRTDAIRYQSEAHLFLFVAIAGLAPARWASANARDRLWLAAPALLALASVPGLVDLTAPDLHERAYAIAIEQAPPRPVVIVVPPREMRDERKVRSDFPDYAVGASVTNALPEDRDACAVWIGPACWSFTNEEVEAGSAARQLGFRNECRELLGGVEATRAALARLVPVEVPHRGEEFHRIPAPRPRLGFAPCAQRAAISPRANE